MIAVLSHRLEGSKLDDLTLGAEVTELLMNLPQFADSIAVVPFLYGVLDRLESAEELVETLLPGAVHAVMPALGSRFHVAMVDPSGGKDLPFTGMAPTRSRALLAAAFRAFDHRSSIVPHASPVADNANAPAFLSRVAEAAE